MQYPGKAPPPFVESHRLTPDTSSRGRGLVPIDASTIAALHAIGRRPPPRDRLRFTLALVLALVFHILLIVLMRYEMLPRPLEGFAIPRDKDEVMEVRFIEPTPPAPAVANVPPPPPVAEPPPKVRSREATRPEPPRPKEEPAPQAETPPPPPQLNLFGKDGSIAMPKAGAGNGTTQASFVPRAPTGDSQIMSHKTTVTYKETRFEKDWAPRDENIVNGGLRKAMEKTTLKKTFDLGHGVRVKCATVFLVLPVGCGGEDPSKASSKVGDTRLNMAPAKSLAGDDPNQPPPPSQAECIASYRRNETVMAGCPSDTPLKAMDQENAERARRAGS